MNEYTQRGVHKRGIKKRVFVFRIVLIVTLNFVIDMFSFNWIKIALAIHLKKQFLQYPLISL